MTSDPQIELALELLRGQLETHWNKISIIRSATAGNKVSVSARIVFDCGGPRPLINVSLSATERLKDDASAYVEDPKQGKLPIDEITIQDYSSHPVWEGTQADKLDAELKEKGL